MEAPSGEILIKRNRWWKRLGPPDPDDITIEPQEGSEWQRGEPDQKKPPKKKQAPSGSSKKGWIPFMPDETAYRHPGSPESPPTSNPSNPTRTTTRTVATVTGEEQMEIPIGTPDYTNRRITGEESGMDHVSIGVGVGTHSGSGSSSGEENQQTEGQNR